MLYLIYLSCKVESRNHTKNGVFPKNQRSRNIKPNKMKKFKYLAILIVSSVVFSSCAFVRSPLSGFLYTSMKNPHSITSNSGASKVGTAEAMSILGLVATGDASIDAAAKAAGISKIHHVDEEATVILGIIAKYKIYVYGE